MKKVLSLVLATVIFAACVGNDKVVLRSSAGKINKVMMVLKTDDWKGDIGKEIKNTFGELQVGLPQPEPIMSVSQIPPAGFSNMMRANRSIFIIKNSKKEVFTIKHNVYASPQTVVYLYADGKKAIIERFKKHHKEIMNAFRKSDLLATQRVFYKDRLDDSKYKTLQKLGLSFIIHKNFKTVDDTGEFLWLRHRLTSGIAKTGSNNILVYSVPLGDETKVSENILKVRDNIGKQYIPGSDPETMHMITEVAYTPQTFDSEIAGLKAFETRGKWEVKNDFMAGPFLNYTVIDKKNNRLIVFEGFTYAPSVNKRAFLFELEAIGKSMVIK